MESVGKAKTAFNIRANIADQMFLTRTLFQLVDILDKKRHKSQVYSEPSRTSKMGLLVEMVKYFFANSSTFNVTVDSVVVRPFKFGKRYFRFLFTSMDIVTPK